MVLAYKMIMAQLWPHQAPLRTVKPLPPTRLALNLAFSLSELIRPPAGARRPMIRNAARKMDNASLRRLASLASVGVAASLIIAKIAAYFYTDSVALLSSLVDSGVDLLASLITAYGVREALKPADHDHRFGHGKAESLAALMQAAFIIGSSILLSIEALGRFITPQPIENAGIGYLVMGFAIVMTLMLLALQNLTVKRTGSIAIASDRLHYVGDVLINLAVIATLALEQWFNQTWIDPLFALGIAASMIYSAAQIARKALDVLMDAELPDAERTAIIALACAVPGVRGVHDLRTRTDSERLILELHVEMDGSIPLIAAHDIAEKVTIAIRARYANADILVHQDPFGIVEDKLDAHIDQHKPRT